MQSANTTLRVVALDDKEAFIKMSDNNFEQPCADRFCMYASLQHKFTEFLAPFHRSKGPGFLMRVL